MASAGQDLLREPLTLPSGAVLRNRIVKSAMSDSLGDGRGNPTPAQVALYRRWAEGGAAALIVGEVQSRRDAAESPGNLVLDDRADRSAFGRLAASVAGTGTALWLQLGHAGALTHAATGRPRGPSALDLPGLRCEELSAEEIESLPAELAATASRARELGFGGVQVHAAHGFLLSQFLSPLFNRRTDRWGGPVRNRMRLLLDVVAAVRAAVGPDFAVAVKLNATDQLEGGLTPPDALEVVGALDGSGADLVDISGGTYFPGAAAASDGAGSGPYFAELAALARRRGRLPVMLTGGVKTRAQALRVLADGGTDVVGLARGLVLDHQLPSAWLGEDGGDPAFPRFEDPPAGGVTAWYTRQIAALAETGHPRQGLTVPVALAEQSERDEARIAPWLRADARG